MLGHSDVGVAQHFSHVLHRDSIGQADDRGIGVPGRVRGEVLVDVAPDGDLLQIRIHFLIARHGQ